MGQIIAFEKIRRSIISLRGHRVMLSPELAVLYGVEHRVLVQAMKRNAARFPDDFMFQLSSAEVAALRSQSVISKPAGRGGARYPPYALTEQGVAMLSTVLNSERAIEVNIEIMRTFVRLRQWVIGNRELGRKVAELEKRYDGQFKLVFEALQELMEPSPARAKKQIGFNR